jgi:hypothetical protein
MGEQPTSYLVPSLEVRLISAKARYGVFARRPVPAGSILAVWGGHVILAAEFLRMPPERRRAGIQVEEALFLVTPSSERSEDFIHSCDPNAEMSGRSR